MRMCKHQKDNTFIFAPSHNKPISIVFEKLEVKLEMKEKEEG